MDKKKIKKLAFTLAETLITLAIIGVVMALMLRSVNRASPNKEKLLFIKSYRAIEHAIDESINDQDKYDQAYYASNPTNGHVDFSQDPYPEYTARINGSSYSSISKDQAVCIWLAEHINILGTPTCDSNPAVDASTKTGGNFKATNGVCYGNWYESSTDGEITGFIDPLCNGTATYTVTIYPNGKVTVPETSGAWNWMQEQTKL